LDKTKIGDRYMADTSNLNSRQILACEYYIKGMSLVEAMRKAGYNDSYCEGKRAGWRYLQNRHVQNYIRERKKEIASVAFLDTAWIAKHVKDWIEEGNTADRVKAAELLNRLVNPDVENSVDETSKKVTITFTKKEKKND
jgi:phage terminase small subunit